jgi:hypothetical protein
LRGLDELVPAAAATTMAAINCVHFWPANPVTLRVLRRTIIERRIGKVGGVDQELEAREQRAGRPCYDSTPSSATRSKTC